MILVAVAPLLIMMIQGYHCARQAVLQLTGNQLITMVETKQMRIADWFVERQQEIKSLAAFATIHVENPDGCASVQGLFNQAHRNNPVYESMTLYSADWKRLASAGATVKDQELLLDEHFREKMSSQSEVVISLPHFHDDGAIVIHLGLSVAGGKQYVVTVLNLSDTLYPLLAQQPAGGLPVHSYILTKEGVALSPSTHGAPLLKTRVKLPAELLAGANQTALYTDAHGKRVLGAATLLEHLNWRLISESPTKDIYAWLVILRERAVGTGVATLIAVVFLAFFLAKRITRPLHYMSAVAHQISSGQYDTRMMEQSGREHRELAQAFNQMLDEIARAQARLAQAAALSAIGELSASIVHEMRNPLSAIKMNLEVLKQSAQDDPVSRELGDIASEQIQRLETMLGDLLQYGRTLEIKKQTVQVDDFVQELKRSIRLTEGKNIHFSFKNESQIKTLFVDTEHFLRAVTNLVDNAIQASPPNETVELSIHQDPTSHLLTFRVFNRGTGVPKRVAEKLFDPFFTTKDNGTGLGLSNVKKIVDLHGGQVSFENLDNGVAFILTLKNNEMIG